VPGPERASSTVGLAESVERLRADAAAPVMLGFGISTPEQVAEAIAAGAAGGRLAPSLAAGSSAGAALAIALHTCGVEASVPVLAIAGAGAVLATTQRAPVFGIVFTWELARAGAWTLVALFAVVVEGTRTSFSIGMGATVLSMLIAISLGLSAGYLGGWWDAIVSRLTDITLGFPHLVFMIAISAIIPATAPRVPVMILIIGILGWPSTARVLRSRTMAVRARTFVGASRAMGAGGLHIMTTQVLPNLVATIIVLTTISIPGKITAEAALSFLGVGVPPPTPSWGRSIGSAITWVATDPWYLVFPGAALFLVTLAFNLFGDGLRDALDPKDR